ncbi:MAG TPA: transporter [Bacteroidia bacterium]|nr:transporter [Bacteroidia bacterium]HNT80630.1 transporter [Bacteroidia bacterium]
MKRVFIIVLCLLINTCVTFGQEVDPISTDRPDQTEGSSTVPKGFFQAEIGLLYGNTNDKFPIDIYAIPSALFRYGITPRIEARLITEYLSFKDKSASQSGLAPIAVGSKVNVLQENGVIPEVAILGHVSIKDAASEIFRQNYFAPDIRASLSHTLTEQFSLGYNIGLEWDGYTGKNNGLYTVAIGYSISDHFGTYAEVFGLILKGETINGLDAGFTYLLSSNTQLDISAGTGISEKDKSYYISVGFSSRFK